MSQYKTCKNKIKIIVFRSFMVLLSTRFSKNSRWALFSVIVLKLTFLYFFISYISLFFNPSPFSSNSHLQHSFFKRVSCFAQRYLRILGEQVRRFRCVSEHPLLELPPFLRDAARLPALAADWLSSKPRQDGGL